MRLRLLRTLLVYGAVGVSAAVGARVLFRALGLPSWTTILAWTLLLVGLPVALWVARGAGGRGRDRAPGRRGTDPDDLLERAQELFLEALELPAERWDAYVERGAAGDRAVADEARALLRAHARQGPLDVARDRIVAPLADEVRSVADLEGQTLRHYEIEERLGGGGMGVVYRARDVRLARTVALKFLSSHLLSDPEAKERFLLEARAAAALDHPNICTVHDIGEADDGRLYIAMAYCEGETLQRRIGRGRIRLDEALDITAQVCRGLAQAARHGILHRDIKPGNLILTDDGRVKIVDFGLAKTGDAGLTRTGARMGTVSYMSPEQTRGEPVDHRTDVWSVGVVLYEMVTGTRPFKGGSDQAVIHSILNEAPVPPQELVEGLPVGVAALIDRALQKDPVRRWPDAKSMLLAAERLLADPKSGTDSMPSLPPEGERRLITVLACAISGFENLLEGLEPGAVEREVTGLRTRVQGVVEDYGGVLNEFAEDRVVALFGVPVAHEDDALRAVRAALEIRELQRGPVELRLAVGSGHVPIRAAETGNRPYWMGGRVVTDVARLASVGSVGDVLAFPDLARALTPFVETEQRASVRISPDLPLVAPLAVLCETDVDSRLDASRPGSLTRFVGRSTEVDRLTRALEGAEAGSGSVVTVIGDAGVGKSRLLHEFRGSLANRGVPYVQGRCQAHGALTPFLPFIECVKAMLGWTRAHPERGHDLVVEGTRALGRELEIYLPVLLHLLSIESDAYPLPEYLKGEDLRAAVGEALVSVLTLGSQGRPLVLLLEDWHWADGGSADVLDQLTEMVTAYPVLLVVTARPERGAARNPLRGHVQLDLAPLDAGSSVEVMRASLRGAGIPEELSDHIAEKTGGNPFFIEELCHTLLDSGTILVEDGEARLAGSLDRLTIPDTVQGVLKTRLDRLDPEAREVLRSASVIGRQFGLELLRRVVPSPSRLESALDGLRTAGLIQLTSLLPEPTYRFKHALTLDVTYDSLLERQRRERHALVGEAIESLYAGRLDELAERLAEHFAGAEDWERAVRYGIAAAERASGLWRLREAATILARTREWVHRRGGSEEWRRETLVRLLLEEERHLETLGDRDGQQALIDELLALLPDRPSPELATVFVRQGELLTLQGRPQDAHAACSRAIQLAEACGAEDVRIMALRAIGHLLWRNDRNQAAVGPLTEVVEWDRQGAPATVLLRDLVNLGRVLRELGEFEEPTAIGEEARAIARNSGNPVDVIYAQNYLGHLMRTAGRPQEALEEFEKGNAVAVAHHLPVRQTFNMLATAALRMELGHLDESFAAYEEAIGLARRGRRPDSLAHALTLYADALMTLGTPGDALPSYEEAVSILRRMRSDHTLSETLGKLALAYEAAGRGEAGPTWREAKRLRLDLGDRAGALAAAEHEAALEGGGDESARSLFAAVLELADQLGDEAAGARARNRLALMAWRAGDLTEAERLYTQAAERVRQADEPGSLGVVLNGLGVVLTHAGRLTEAQDVLQEALEANRMAGRPGPEADTLAALGAAAGRAGDAARAYDWYQRCLEKRREAGDRAGEGWALHRLAELSRDAGASERWSAFASAALTIAREVEDAELESLCSRTKPGDPARPT